MKERGILFSGEMVRAILDGRKTQTRRVTGLDYVNAGPDNFVSMTPEEWMAPTANRPALGGYPKERALFKRVAAGRALGGVALLCPFGQPGDRLWVRETWGTVRMHELGQHIYGGPRIPDRDEVVYRAGKVMGIPIPDTSPIEFRREWRDDFQPARWRPSIHMPRWASRITLEVTGVRVEHVQEITPVDAAAEAADDIILNPKHPLRSAAYERSRTIRGERYAGIVEGYAALWDSLNAKRGYGWDANPWVWVIEFRRVEA